LKPRGEGGNISDEKSLSQVRVGGRGEQNSDLVALAKEKSGGQRVLPLVLGEREVVEEGAKKEKKKCKDVKPGKDKKRFYFGGGQKNIGLMLWVEGGNKAGGGFAQRGGAMEREESPRKSQASDKG